MSQTLLNPGLERFIEQELSLGRYTSREALIEQALTLPNSTIALPRDHTLRITGWNRFTLRRSL